MGKRERHLRLTRIFTEAMELPLAERDVYLAQACGGDLEMEREVRELLRYDGPELVSPPHLFVQASTTERDRTGRQVGRFRVVSELGRGGMATVWKAEDPLLRRLVAIKFLNEDMRQNDDARHRFIREARAAASLTHPGIAMVFDVGEADGEPYIAMQLIDGDTIKALLRQHAMAPADAARITAAAAEALHHAHLNGVVHRDVTSKNLMVQRDGATKIMDFGVARRSMDSSRLSKSGEIVGTVGYMSPEAIRGELATPQSDVFSLGIVLYEMLTGYLPFSGKTTLAIQEATLHSSPERAGQIVPAIPRELDTILELALARNLATRYPSANDMAADLRVLADRQVLSSEGRPALRRPKPGNRHAKRYRLAFGILMIVVVVAVVWRLI